MTSEAVICDLGGQLTSLALQFIISLHLLDVPDLREEGRQLPVDHAQLEARLGVGVAEGAELGEDGEQLGEADHVLLLALRHHVRLQRLHVDLLDLLHPLRLAHVVPVTLPMNLLV